MYLPIKLHKCQQMLPIIKAYLECQMSLNSVNIEFKIGLSPNWISSLHYDLQFNPFMMMADII